MAADTFPDRVTRITARERSSIILASEDRQRVSRETPNQGLCTFASSSIPFIRKIVGPREQKVTKRSMALIWQRPCKGWNWKCRCPREKGSDAADRKPEKVT